VLFSCGCVQPKVIPVMVMCISPYAVKGRSDGMERSIGTSASNPNE